MEYPELRQDVITGRWVIIAPGRMKRPVELHKKAERERSKPEECPFEDPLDNVNNDPTLVYGKGADWSLMVLPNKYPALTRLAVKTKPSAAGSMYRAKPAYGFHELIITRDHDATFPLLSKSQAGDVLKAAQERYRFYKLDKKIKYALLIHNFGKEAGASVYHPHYQLLALPFVPLSIERSFKEADNFSKKNGKSPYDILIAEEQRYKKRIVAENKGAIAFTRYASEEPFDMRVFPKNGAAAFEEESAETIKDVAAVLQTALTKLTRQVSDPDYNFYLHAASFTNKKQSSAYRWHIDIVPRLSRSGGVELGTFVEVTTIDPDEAARVLNGKAGK